MPIAHAFLLILLLCFTSCSKSSREVPTHFVLSFTSEIQGDSTFPGGVVIRGLSSEHGDQDFILDSKRTIKLPNGKWTFQAVGFSNPERTIAYCGKSREHNLEGGDVTIDITLSQNFCDESLIEEILLTHFITLPASPRSFSAIFNEGGPLIALSWLAPVNNGGSPLLGFELRYRITGSALWSPPVTISPGMYNFTLTGISTNSFYDLEIKAFNLKGYSPATFLSGISTEVDGGEGAPDPAPSVLYLSTNIINPFNLSLGACGLITVELRDLDDNLVNAQDAIDISLPASSIVDYYTGPSCETPLADNSITIPANSNSVQFYVMSEEVAGILDLELNSPGFDPLIVNLHVLPGPPFSASWLQQPPANIEAGQPFQLQIQLFDSFGNTATNADDPVNLSFQHNPGDIGVIQTADVNMIPVEGIATWTVLIEQAEIYTFIATYAGDFASPASDEVEVFPGPVNSLTVSPSTLTPVVEGEPFLETITVDVRDFYDNPIQSGQVIAQLDTNPNGAFLMGATSQNIINGVASFDNLMVSQAGSNYTLTFSVDGLTYSIHNINILYESGCDPTIVPYGNYHDNPIGSEADPYLICSPEQFLEMDGPDGTFYKLASNIDFTGISLNSAGQRLPAFNATLLGDYRTISNITFVDNSNSVPIGLIGTNNGEIFDLNIENVNVSGSQSTNGTMLGGLVGHNNTTGILYNINAQNITVIAAEAGGLAAWNDGLINSSHISDFDITGSEYAGGMVAWNDEGEIVLSTASTGVIEGEDIGGLVGLNHGILSKTGSIGVNLTGDIFVGGLVGHNASFVDQGGIIEESFAKYGSIHAAGLESVGGGLVGFNEFEIISSFADMQISGSAESESLGGLVGEDMGELVTMSISRSVVNSDGYFYGGFIGYSYATSTYSSNFWHIDLSTQIHAEGEEFEGVADGLDESSYLLQGSFTGFNFGAGTWKWIEGYGPMLNWYNPD
jgi:hypothetical protein